MILRAIAHNKISHDPRSRGTTGRRSPSGTSPSCRHDKVNDTARLCGTKSRSGSFLLRRSPFGTSPSCRHKGVSWKCVAPSQGVGMQQRTKTRRGFSVRHCDHATCLCDALDGRGEDVVVHRPHHLACFANQSSVSAQVTNSFQHHDPFSSTKASGMRQDVRGLHPC
jgi:hypothetical protein